MKRLPSLAVTVYREESATTGQLTEALCKASCEFLPILLDAQGYRDDGTTYRYASIKSIRRSTQAAMGKQGLWLNHVYGHNDEGTFVMTVLRHITGEYITSTLLVPDLPDIQKRKAAMTLLCRTATEGMLSICTEEDDDGASCGQEMTGEVEVATPQQVANLAVAEKAIREATSVSALERYMEIAKARIEEGAFAKSALEKVTALVAARKQELAQENANADGSRVGGHEGADAAGGRGGPSNRGGRRGGRGNGRGDVDARDGSVAVAT